MLRPVTGGGREPSEGVEPRPTPGIGVGRAVLWAEAGIRRGAKGEENISHGCAFEYRVVKGGGEESLPKACAGAHPGAGNKGAAGLFGEDDGGDAVTHAAELAEKGVLYFL